MKKLFYLLFLTILIVKAFPDENEGCGQKLKFSDYFDFAIAPEIATLELGGDLIKNECSLVKNEGSHLYWKLNLLNIHFFFEFPHNYYFDIEITPMIISKNFNLYIPYNFSFVNLRISCFGYSIYPYNIEPFLGINYLKLKEDIFDFDTINLQAGVRFGFFHSFGRDLCYIETGYAYKNNRHNYYFSIGTSLFLSLYAGKIP